MLWFDSLCNPKEKNNLDLARIMADVEIPTEGESHPKEPEKIEEGNIRDGEI